MSTPPRLAQIGDKLIVTGSSSNRLFPVTLTVTKTDPDGWIYFDGASHKDLSYSPCRLQDWYGDKNIGWTFAHETNTVTNKKGGSQSKIETALSLVPPEALLRAGKVLKAGAEKYGIDNWRNIDRRDHIDHALAHIYAHLSGKKTGEDDLTNAMLRIMFAIETQ